MNSEIVNRKSFSIFQKLEALPSPCERMYACIYIYTHTHIQTHTHKHAHTHTHIHTHPRTNTYMHRVRTQTHPQLISRHFSKCHELKTLLLSGNRFGDAGVGALSSEIATFRRLETLDLSQNDVREVSLMKLCFMHMNAQCVAVCCSVLQCVAMSFRVLQCSNIFPACKHQG